VTDGIMTLGAGVLGLGIVTLAGGILLSFAAKRFRIESNPIIESIDALLPQTQCGQCGYPGCQPYAKAIISGESINRCPPGGQNTVDRLADLLGLPTTSLDADPEAASQDKVAVIIEEDCIGCTKCIQACPVDAIIGAAKLMHTVIFNQCTGCDLCIEPCPMDCIKLIPRPLRKDHWIPASPPLIATDRSSPLAIKHG
jgi:electron transport complex protein RnfB